MNRKAFFTQTLFAGSAISMLPAFRNNLFSQGDPQLDKAIVQEFVGAAHRDIEKIKTMLQEHPNLLNAAHDWKFGDFETALGAAQHVGYLELVKYLVEKGAQADIFTAVLFGRMDVVQPFLTAFPSALHSKGPHGYTLLHHANQGGDDALEVKSYLVSLGAVETRILLY